MSKTQEEIQAELDASANAETTNTVTPTAEKAVEDQTKTPLKAEPKADAKPEEGFGPMQVSKIKMVKEPFQFKHNHAKCPLKWAQVIITDDNVEIFEFADKLQELSDASQATHVAHKKSLSSGKPFFEGFTQERLTFSEQKEATANAATILLQKMQELGMNNSVGLMS